MSELIEPKKKFLCRTSLQRVSRGFYYKISKVFLISFWETKVLVYKRLSAENFDKHVFLTCNYKVSKLLCPKVQIMGVRLRGNVRQFL